MSQLSKVSDSSSSYFKSERYLTLQKTSKILLNYYERRFTILQFPSVLRDMIVKFSVGYNLEWSKTHKSQAIKVLKNQMNIRSSVFKITKTGPKSIRCEYPLPTTEITKWTVECSSLKKEGYYFFGIVGGNNNDYEIIPHDDGFAVCYGMDTAGSVYASKRAWNFSHFKFVKNQFTLRIIGDTLLEFEYNPKISVFSIKQKHRICKFCIKEKDKKMEFYAGISWNKCGIGAKCEIKVV